MAPTWLPGGYDHCGGIHYLHRLERVRVLLGPIMRDARPRDLIVVYPGVMRERVEQVVRAANCDDLVIRQVEAPPSTPVA